MRATAATVDVQPSPRGGWVQVANSFIDAAPLDNERLAQIVLMSYDWDETPCAPLQADMAARLGISVRTIKRRVGALRQAALVTVQRGGGETRANVYHLHVRPAHADGGTAFTTVPHYILDDPDLSQGAKRTYVLLCRRAGAAGAWAGSQAALGVRLGVAIRTVYEWVRELETADCLRIIARRGRSNRYVVETPERRKRASVVGPLPPVPTALISLEAPARWQRLYRETMGGEPTRRLCRGVRALVDDVGEDVVLEAIEGAAAWAARRRVRMLTINMLRVEAAKITGEAPLAPGSDNVEMVQIMPPSEDTDPIWRGTLRALQSEMTADNYRRWFASTRSCGRTHDDVGDIVHVGVADDFHRQWLDGRLRHVIERVLARVAPGVRVAFRVADALSPPEETARGTPDATSPPRGEASARAPARDAPLTVARCRHCHYLPCRCSRSARRERERVALKEKR